MELSSSDWLSILSALTVIVFNTGILWATVKTKILTAIEDNKAAITALSQSVTIIHTDVEKLKGVEKDIERIDREIEKLRDADSALAKDIDTKIERVRNS